MRRIRTNPRKYTNPVITKTHEARAISLNFFPYCPFHRFTHSPTRLSHVHVRHINRAERFQQTSNFVVVVLSVTRFDYKKESVTSGKREVWRIKNRMVWLWQLVQRKHPQDRSKRRAEYRALERNRNESRHAIERFSANVQWIVNYFHPVL